LGRLEHDLAQLFVDDLLLLVGKDAAGFNHRVGLCRDLQRGGCN
jgi:hypothetical protein